MKDAAATGRKYKPRAFGLIFSCTVYLFSCFIVQGCSSRNSGPATYSQSQANPSPVSFVSDMMLMARIKSKFISDDMVDDNGIHIKVRSGVVYLEGWAADEYHCRMAKDLVRSVDGVVRVESSLQIANQGTVFEKPDIQVKKQITMALLNDPVVSSQPVTVLVNKDRIILSGLVENQAQSRKAESIAAGYAGQRVVVNHIQAPPR